ncbi:ClpXP protease specificity-enhancing factor [Sulfuriferula thiophila]|uniref:ClpXP protease specificity-enhancing factor n=1 Tax=Sulfuriferula thiophila TaxID=1781211 RepID=UPI000F608D6D|nr:ClpXP protease specificity-enhancing factor [Sulfuriferula thiophila]
MPDKSTKPYLIRAIYEWCIDSGYTPFLSVVVDSHTRVPLEYVKDGQIVLNLSPNATQGMLMDNDWVRFSARFNGISRQIEIPVSSVAGIFARENGEGLGFEVAAVVGAGPVDSKTDLQTDTDPPPSPKPTGKPKLQVVK